MQGNQQMLSTQSTIGDVQVKVPHSRHLVVELEERKALKNAPHLQDPLHGLIEQLASLVSEDLIQSKRFVRHVRNDPRFQLSIQQLYAKPPKYYLRKLTPSFQCEKCEASSEEDEDSPLIPLPSISLPKIIRPQNHFINARRHFETPIISTSLIQQPEAPSDDVFIPSAFPPPSDAVFMPSDVISVPSEHIQVTPPPPEATTMTFRGSSSSAGWSNGNSSSSSTSLPLQLSNNNRCSSVIAPLVANEPRSVFVRSKKPRQCMTAAQLEVLGKYFESESQPSAELRNQIGCEIGASAERVTNWFMNRRRKRRERIAQTNFSIPSPLPPIPPPPLEQIRPPETPVLKHEVEEGQYSETSLSSALPLPPSDMQTQCLLNDSSLRSVPDAPKAENSPIFNSLLGLQQLDHRAFQLYQSTSALNSANSANHVNNSSNANHVNGANNTNNENTSSTNGVKMTPTPPMPSMPPMNEAKKLAGKVSLKKQKKRARSADIKDLYFSKMYTSDIHPFRLIRIWVNERSMAYYDCVCGRRKAVQDLKKIKDHADRHFDFQDDKYEVLIRHHTQNKKHKGNETAAASLRLALF